MAKSAELKRDYMIFVTGASGNVGRLVLRRLRQLAQPVRVGAYSQHADNTEPSVESVRFDFLDPSTFDAAVAGCAGVFLLGPPAISSTRQTLNVFLDVVRRHGASRVVFISVAGAGKNPLVPHHAVEQHLRAA